MYLIILKIEIKQKDNLKIEIKQKDNLKIEIKPKDNFKNWDKTIR